MKRCRTLLLTLAGCILWGSASQAQGLGVASFSAVVDENGNTLVGTGVQASSKVGPGAYVVQFPRDLTLCTMVATVRGRKVGFASVRYPAEELPNSIKVLTFSPDGARANLGFNVLVNCAS